MKIAFLILAHKNPSQLVHLFKLLNHENTGVFLHLDKRVNIGSGAVIGANSVVTKDFPPYAVFAGNPGKAIKYRFSDEKIKDLLELRWWEWDIDKIKKNKTLFL